MTLSKQVDREQRSLYTLIITATDKGVPSKHSEVNLKINVLDVNDNTPQFNKSTLVGSVLENEADVTSVMRVMAEDSDSGRNAELVFNFTSKENTNLFSLDFRTGEIFTTKSLDREKQERYVLKISVSDRGSPQLSSSADVTIDVIDVDDNCPKFHPAEYNVTIKENLPFGESIVQVTATDVDVVANEKIKYDIRDGNTGGAFLMNRTSGEC